MRSNNMYLVQTIYKKKNVCYSPFCSYILEKRNLTLMSTEREKKRRKNMSVIPAPILISSFFSSKNNRKRDDSIICFLLLITLYLSISICQINNLKKNSLRRRRTIRSSKCNYQDK